MLKATVIVALNNGTAHVLGSTEVPRELSDCAVPELLRAIADDYDAVIADLRAAGDAL